LLKIPLNKPAPLKREKCRKTMSRIVFAVWQYASLPKGLNSYLLLLQLAASRLAKPIQGKGRKRIL